MADLLNHAMPITATVMAANAAVRLILGNVANAKVSAINVMNVTNTNTVPMAMFLLLVFQASTCLPHAHVKVGFFDLMLSFGTGCSGIRTAS